MSDLYFQDHATSARRIVADFEARYPDEVVSCVVVVGSDGTIRTWLHATMTKQAQYDHLRETLKQADQNIAEMQMPPPKGRA